MKRFLLAAVLFAVIAPGCVSVSAEDRAFYDSMVAAGESPCSWPSPIAAGLLAILPGGGQFYNAQFGQATAAVLFWPVSYFWTIPTAIINAKRINIRRSVAYWQQRKAGG